MSATGVNYQDLVPVPEKTNAIAEPDQHEKAHALADGPTASHAIAQGRAGDHSRQGVAQQDHDLEVKDLGWNEAAERVPAPLVGGIGNEELWLLVRRFNKQMYHVKETTVPVAGNLDLNIADEDEFSPDKLRSTLERLYMTVLVGLLGLFKHLIRIRSWRETRRSAGFLAAYTLAWALDVIVPLITGTLILLIVYPPSRAFLFPPAPLALVGTDGAPQKPKAGVLGSKDSATGAPENYKGEAVEAEAQNFVNSIAQVALSSAAGKHPMNDPDDDDDGSNLADAAPDPTALAGGAASARTKVSTAQPSPKVDKTKAPMETAIWNQMRPAMHALQDVVDTWERFANALDPTPPFPQEPFRLRIASLVIPLFAVSFFISSYIFVKAVWFGVGFGFFGQPAIDAGLYYLNSHFPNWQKLLELRNTLLKGVPTNAQLTITLLRVGEANKAPLPPPPMSTEAPDSDTTSLHEDHLAATGADAPLGATEAEIQAAAAHDGGVSAHHTDGGGVDASKDSKHGHKGSKILGLFKGGVKASVNSALGVDHARAAVGSSAAKDRKGVVPKPRPDLYVSGPVEFKARYKGSKGHVYISTKATIPCVSFSTDSTIETIGSQDREDLHPLWSIAVADIKEIKKVGGFGWKAKLFVGWALERTVADGVEIVDREGRSTKVTAMPTRDELFNRLVAMGGQKWEAW